LLCSCHELHTVAS